MVLSSLALIQACGSSPTPASSNTISLTEANTTSIPTFIIRGEVTLGHEVRAITPCNSHQQYWIDLPKDRFQQALNLVQQPYQPLYGELIGYLQPPSNGGFGADYHARFVVTQVNHLSTENPQRCTQKEKPPEHLVMNLFGLRTFPVNQYNFHHWVKSP